MDKNEQKDIKPVKIKKSRRQRSTRNVKIPKLRKKLLTALDRVADLLLDVTSDELPTRDSGTLLIHSLKLLKELEKGSDEDKGDVSVKD